MYDPDMLAGELEPLTIRELAVCTAVCLGLLIWVISLIAIGVALILSVARAIL